jgi:hypothetical protein
VCKPHWNQFTNALRKAAMARKAAEAEPAEPERVPAKARRRSKGAVAAEDDAA